MFIKKLNELIENLNLEIENLKKMSKTLNNPDSINENNKQLISEIEELKKKIVIFSEEENLKTEQNNKYVSELQLQCYNYQLQIENLKNLESLKIEKLKNEISQNFILIGHLEKKNKDFFKINSIELNKKDNFNLEDDHVSIIIMENESLKKKLKNLDMEVKKGQNIESLQLKLKKKDEKIEKVEQKNTTLEFETVN